LIVLNGYIDKIYN